MARACRDVRDANKVLIVSRLHSLDQFEGTKRWGAKAGYIHGDFDALARRNDEIDAHAGLPETAVKMDLPR